MMIEGSVRSNLLAAIASARRWRGRRVHNDTIEHWGRLVDYAGRVATQPSGERISDLVTQLEAELIHARAGGEKRRH